MFTLQGVALTPRDRTAATGHPEGGGGGGETDLGASVDYPNSFFNPPPILVHPPAPRTQRGDWQLRRQLWLAGHTQAPCALIIPLDG